MDKSFNQETTLCGKSIIKNIKIAKENGFYVVMNYIGVENPQIAKDRVKLRVSKGGMEYQMKILKEGIMPH